MKYYIKETKNIQNIMMKMKIKIKLKNLNKIYILKILIYKI